MKQLISNKCAVQMLLALLLLISGPVYSQLDLKYLGVINNFGHDRPLCFDVDSAGNISIALQIGDTLSDIQPGPGVYNVSGQYNSVYIARYDSTGMLLKAFFLPAYANKIRAGEDGSFYISGNYFGCVDFDPGPGVNQICANSSWGSLYYAKYDSSGALVFVNNITSTQNNSINIYNSAFSSDGELLIGGWVEDNIFVNGNIVVFANPVTNYDACLIRFDSTGTVTGSYLFESSVMFSIVQFHDIEFDSNGNFIVCGWSSGPGVTFGNPGASYTTSASNGGYIVKMTPSGDVIFGAEFSMGGNTETVSVYPRTDNKTAFVGVFDQPFDADPGPGTLILTPQGYMDMCYGVLDSLGGLVFVKQVSTVQGEIQPYSMVCDSYNNMYITGEFNSKLIADPSTGIPEVSSYGIYSDQYYARFDNNGMFSYFLPLESDSSHTLYDYMMLSKNEDRLYTTVSFYGAVDFDLTLGMQVVPNPFIYHDLAMMVYDIENTPQNPNSYFAVSGTVFADLNGNGIQDTGDPGIEGAVIHIQPGNHYAITDSHGFYIKYIQQGFYNVTLSSPGLVNPSLVTVSPLSHNAAVSINNQHDAYNDFALFPNSAGYDLEVVTTPYTLISQLLPFSVQTTARNNFVTPVSGTVGVQYDSLLTLTGSVPVADSLAIGFTGWDVDTIGPFGKVVLRSDYYSISVLAPDTVIWNSQVLPVAGDLLTANNYDTLVTQVLGSYDPNSKIVSPEGDILLTQVQSGVDLDYTIYFQNTGQAPAWRVLIIDTLSGKLDFASFRMVDNSHDCNVQLQDDSILVFTFNNIMLPDSGTNEPGSHGFVRYKIKPETNLVAGSIIENNAAIIFDLNEPVITNSVINTVVDPLSVYNPNGTGTGILYPSITGGDVYYALPENWNSKQVYYSVIDFSGRKIVNRSIIDKSNPLLYGFTDEPGGLYFFIVECDGKMLNQKIIYK